MEGLDIECILSAYTQGAFPMTDRDGRIRWYTADPRGLIPLDDRFHVSRSLRQCVAKKTFDVRFNTDFPQTMRLCMLGRDEGSWISDKLIAAYIQLNEIGLAHSVECWQNDQLVGGLYGVSLGAAFFGESMFHRAPNASKVALFHLVQRLRERQFQLLDAQAQTQHLTQFGCYQIPATEYLPLLQAALVNERRFD